MSPADSDATYDRRVAEGRCTRCGSWPTICGHGLPLAERMKSIQIDKRSLRVH